MNNDFPHCEWMRNVSCRLPLFYKCCRFYIHLQSSNFVRCKKNRRRILRRLIRIVFAKLHYYPGLVELRTL